MMSEPNSISTFHITVPRTARVAAAGKLSPDTRYIWIACHGYGEIASEFITRMTAIVREDTYLIAPEALSRFYWGEGFSGKPVASWMTKEDRLNEINDYANYLSILQEDLISKASDDVKFVFFGFSQGCATVMRWANAKHPHCSAIVLWAGMLPEDIDYDSSYYDELKLYARGGDQDRFMTTERLEKHETLIHEKGLHFDVGMYEGKHKVYDEPLLALRDQIYASI